MSAILPLGSQHEDAVEALLDAAFGTDRRGRTAYTIRDGMPWIESLSFAALGDDGTLLGSLHSWPVALHLADGGQMPLIMVGPVAVHPAHQRDGHGRALMDAIVSAARAQASETLMMIGDPEYYGRFWGFSADGTAGWTAPGPFEPRRLLALSVNGGTVNGKGILGPRISVIA